MNQTMQGMFYQKLFTGYLFSSLPFGSLFTKLLTINLYGCGFRAEIRKAGLIPHFLIDKNDADTINLEKMYNFLHLVDRLLSSGSELDNINGLRVLHAILSQNHVLEKSTKLTPLIRKAVPLVWKFCNPEYYTVGDIISELVLRIITFDLRRATDFHQFFEEKSHLHAYLYAIFQSDNVKAISKSLEIGLSFFSTLDENIQTKYPAVTWTLGPIISYFVSCILHKEVKNNLKSLKKSNTFSILYDFERQYCFVR